MSLINSLEDLAGLVEFFHDETAFLYQPPNLYREAYYYGDPGNPALANMLMNFYDVNASRIIGADGTVNKEYLASYYRDMLAIEGKLKEYMSMEEAEAARLQLKAYVSTGGTVIVKDAESLASGEAEINLQTIRDPENLSYISEHLSGIEGMALKSMFNGSGL